MVAPAPNPGGELVTTPSCPPITHPPGACYQFTIELVTDPEHLEWHVAWTFGAFEVGSTYTLLVIDSVGDILVEFTGHTADGETAQGQYRVEDWYAIYVLIVEYDDGWWDLEFGKSLDPYYH